MSTPLRGERTAQPATSPDERGDGTHASGLIGSAHLDSALDQTGREAEIFRGSGPTQASRRAVLHAVKIANDGDITLDFVNAEVKDVLKYVLGDLLKLNYTVDPGVQGIMTIQTSKPITRDAVLPSLESALRLVGVAIVQADGRYSVVQLRDAARLGVPIQGSTLAAASGAGYEVRIVPLKFVSVNEMQKLIEPFSRAGTIISVDRNWNLLVLGGTEQELSSVLENIGLFDVDWMAGMSFALFPLKSVSPKVMAAELDQIIGGQGGPVAGLVRLVPIERMNSLLVISPQSSYLDKLQVWIDRLDRSSDAAERRIYVYYVQNGRAADLAGVLTKILTGRGSDRSAASKNAAQSPTADAGYALGGSASRSPMGAPGGLGGASGLGGSFPTPALPPGSSTVTPQGPTGDDAAAASGDSGDNGRNVLRITADETNNALLVLATAQEYALIEAALKKLDIIPLQVLLEAAIAEVTLTKDLKYGVQFLFKPGTSNFTFSPNSSGAVASAFPGFSYLFSRSDNISVVLNALSTLTDLKVVSAPKLLVLNNQTATLQVGDQVPIATQQAVSVLTPNAPIVNTIEFRDTGVILKVTPRVNESGLVLMDVSQEVSDVAATTTSNIDSPTIQQRRFTSTIAIHNGETIALGGLIRDSRTKGKTGIPLLQDIPVLGNLFSNNDNNLQRTELLVLITPTVVRDQQGARDITEELRQKLRATAPVLDRSTN